MLKTIRVILAVICLLAVTMLFLDVTGTAVRYVGWLAKWQFMPALLAMNVVVVAVLVVIARYCARSELCRMSYRGFTERWPSAASSHIHLPSPGSE